MSFITLNDQNVVVAIRNGKEILDGEIKSEVGEVGQIMQTDGTFVTPKKPPTVTKPSLEEQMMQLQQDNLILMDALAMTFEEVMMLRAEIGGIV